MSRKFDEEAKRGKGGGERSGGEETMSSASLDNPVCLDENYPALYCNYFIPLVSMFKRMHKKLNMDILTSTILYVKLII